MKNHPGPVVNGLSKLLEFAVRLSINFVNDVKQKIRSRCSKHVYDIETCDKSQPCLE